MSPTDVSDDVCETALSDQSQVRFLPYLGKNGLVNKRLSDGYFAMKTGYFVMKTKRCPRIYT
jgi:hypothetical protein